MGITMYKKFDRAMIGSKSILCGDFLAPFGGAKISAGERQEELETGECSVKKGGYEKLSSKNAEGFGFGISATASCDEQSEISAAQQMDVPQQRASDYYQIMGEIYVRAARRCLQDAKDLLASARVAVSYMEEAKKYFSLSKHGVDSRGHTTEEDQVFAHACEYFKTLTLH